jgi:phosphoenolpyruvate carboxykinase (ATP)
MSTDLSRHGLRAKREVHWNLAAAELCEHAIRRGEGRLAECGAFVAITKPHTGRSPSDKFVVREPTTESQIWWGEVNVPFEPARFETLREAVLEHLSTQELYVRDV